MERGEDKERKIDEEQQESRERERESCNWRKLYRNSCEFGAFIESNKSVLL